MLRPNLQTEIPTQERAAARLGIKLERHLLAYTTAATAAGMGMLVSALPAEAKIVYTPSNIPIVQNGGLIPLDLDNDGTPDFEFSNFSYQSHGLGDIFLKVQPTRQSNEIWDVKSQGHLCAAALPRGKQVGPGGRFQRDPSKGLYMAFIGLGGSTGTNLHFGPWFKVETAFLGLRFKIKGKIHFGWARIEFSSQGFFETARISGYAYETLADKPILTGAQKGPAAISQAATPATFRSVPKKVSASLGLLARGAATLGIWRRMEETA
jgi:hypothetical protein